MLTPTTMKRPMPALAAELTRAEALRLVVWHLGQPGYGGFLCSVAGGLAGHFRDEWDGELVKVVHEALALGGKSSDGSGFGTPLKHREVLRAYGRKWTAMSEWDAFSCTIRVVWGLLMARHFEELDGR